MLWHVGAFHAFADAGEQDQGEGEADGAAETEEQGFDEVVLESYIEQRHAENRAVGGDQGQVDAQYLMQQRTGFLDDQLGQLNDGGDGDDERQGAQIFQMIWCEQPAVDDEAGAAGHGENERGGRAHAERGLQFFRDTHERV